MATPSAPTRPIAPGTVIAPLDSGPDTIPPSSPSADATAIPGLREFLKPDGTIVLPGGAGTIDRAPDHIGIQINTPGGPFQINVPRRQRDLQAEDDAAGPDGTSPPPRGRGAHNAGRASREFTIASRIFATRNYPNALRRLNRYLDRDAGDRDLLQLRSLTNFAMTDYPAAYHDALAATADGDVWDWTTLRSLYRSPGEYTAQYRALEEAVSARQNSVESMFLLAYHDLMLGHHAAARREFARVAALDSSNETARHLATGEGPPQPHSQTLGTPGVIPKTGTASNVPPAPPQAKPSGGPSVDLGQPAQLGPPDKATPSGAK